MPIALETLEVSYSEKKSMIGSTSNVAEGVVFSAALLKKWRYTNSKHDLEESVDMKLPQS